MHGHHSVVSSLISNGADPNLAHNDGWTPHMEASENGHNDVVELLLKWNVPVNTQSNEGKKAIFLLARMSTLLLCFPWFW